MPAKVIRFLKRFASDTSGGVAVISAVTLPVLIGISALSLEYGTGLLVRAENQRISDIASYSGASVYMRTSGSTADREAEATRVARNVAALNGINPDEVEVTFPEDPEGGILVQADIRTERRLMLARVISDETMLGVTNRAVTRVGDSGSACIIALAQNAQGVVLEGGTTIRADDCGVASNAALRFHEGCSTKIISNETVTYRTEVIRPECVRTPDRINDDGSGRVSSGEVDDPIAEARQAALDAAGALFPLPAVSAGTSITFGWWQGDPSTRNGAVAAGCDDNPTYSNNKWTITCRNDVTFSSLRIPGGMSVEFILEGTAVFSVQGDIDMRYQGGSNRLIIGDGSASLAEINIGGDIRTAGGSCLILGGAGINRIGGNVSLQGGAIFRSGIYAINGYLDAGAGGSNCPGSVLLTTQNATLVVNGSNGTTQCGGNHAFCLSGGQSNTSMTPPSTGTFADFSVIGPLGSANARGAAFTQGAMGSQIKGLFYFPQGTFRANGGSSALPPANDCFQLVAAEIFVVEGAALTAGTCPSFTGGNQVIALIR